MKLKNFISTVAGFLTLSVLLLIINLIDFAIVYSIFLYIQALLAPLLTGIGYFFYILRLSLPYICMYTLIFMLLNIQSYKTNSTIKIFRYTININVVQKTKWYVYLRQYNYVLIIFFNLFLLFMVYYAYINHKYFYLFFVFLFYLSIWVVIKIKHWLFKYETLRYKKVHMLVNIILAVLIGTYISMALEEFHITNLKTFGLENFWKLIDNKYFLKMPIKDFNWNRLFNWSKHTSTDRYMLALKKGLVRSVILSEEQKQLTDIDLDKKPLSSQSIKNDEINLNANLNLSDYFNRIKNEDQNLSKFSNVLYQKFKKVFLMQTHIKSSNFTPTPEMAERQKLLNWLRNPYNFIDLSKFYTSTAPEDATLYDDYLDLVDKKFNNLTTKKVFLITFNKNYFSLKSFAFYADFEYSFKKNYAIFLNSEKNNIDLKNNSMLNFEYYNNDLYMNFEFNNLWLQFQNELYIIFQENKEALSLFSIKFKSLYTIKKFTFSFREDVLEEPDKELLLYNKPKVKNYIMIPDFKKLQHWKTFKLNYKEILQKHITVSKKIKFIDTENKWLQKNKMIIKTPPLNEIFFIFEDDIAYSLSDNKLTQVEDLTFDDSNLNQEYEVLTEYITYYLENIKDKTFPSTKKFSKILINDMDKAIAIMELQSKRVHVPTYNNMYHEILYQNSNNFFKNIIENYAFSRDLLTSSRSFMTFDMWCIAMQKLLNLNKGSFCLNNLKDFSDFCKSDATEDLEFNFSLAFDILQNKYDLNKFLSIPDLEGIPGTFYEYTVKYNEQMNRYFWYEEQEVLIDWVYEISYYSLVNMMDTVKELDSRENDFLYDMINNYLKEPQYKWAADLFDAGLTEKPSKQLVLIDNKFKVLNKLYDIQSAKESLKFIKASAKNIPWLHNKSLLNFDKINSLSQLNYKIELDINVIHKLIKWQMYNIVKTYPGIVDDFTTLHHADFHEGEAELMCRFYSEQQEIYSWDLGALGSVGLHSDHIVPIYHDDYLDLAFEIKNDEKLEYLFEEMDSIMFLEYTQLLETEEFDYWLEDEHADLKDELKFFVLRYKEEVQLARIKIINKMLCDLDLKKVALIQSEFELANGEVSKLQLENEKIKCIELKNACLEKLPIYDWSTYTFIDENVDLLFNENQHILFKKLDEVNLLMDQKNDKLNEMKKVAKLYGKQIVTHAMEKPSTKRYLEKNWDDYNYLANKSDKLRRDWYKPGPGKKK